MTIGSMWARLPDGMSAAQLAANLNRVQTLIVKETTDEDLPTAVKVTPYRNTLVKDAGRPLVLLYAVASSWRGQ